MIQTGRCDQRLCWRRREADAHGGSWLGMANAQRKARKELVHSSRLNHRPSRSTRPTTSKFQPLRCAVVTTGRILLQTPVSYQRCHSLRVCSRLCVSNKISHFRQKTSSGDFTPVPAQRAKLPAFFYLFASQDQRGRQPVPEWLVVDEEGQGSGAAGTIRAGLYHGDSAHHWF